jgi:hypothetical protein
MTLDLHRSVPLFKPRFRTRLRPLTFRLEVAPWLNAAAVFFFFGLAGSRFVLHPGMEVDLPEIPFQSGVPYNAHVLTILGTRTADPSGPPERESYFFDGQKMPREDLLERLSQLAHEDPAAPLLIRAGVEIPHGLVLDLCFRAQSSGLQRVVLATRTDIPARTP